MGSVYGGLFAAAGHDVWLVDIWREHVAAIREHGLHVSGKSGERTVRPSATTRSGRRGTVRARGDRDQNARSSRPRRARSARWAAATPPSSRSRTDSATRKSWSASWTAVISWSVSRAASARPIPRPGAVHHNGWDRLNIAEAASGHSARLARIVEVWRGAGFNAEGYDDPDRMIWGKYICNLAFSPVCTALSLRIGQVLDNPEACRLAERCASEAYAVALGQGHRARLPGSGRPHPRIRPGHSQCQALDAARHGGRDARPRSRR